MKKKLMGWVCATGIIVAGAAWAEDVGDPVFPVDLKDKSRFELIYGNEQRDMDVDGVKAEFEADTYMLRMHTDVGQYAYLDFDVGYMDPSDGSGAFYGGVGLRSLVYDAEKYRMAGHVQGHYAPGIEFNGADADYWSVDGGVTLAGKIKIDEQLTILPYAGPILSTVNLDGDDADASEDHIMGVVAGVSLELREMNTIRIEARYIDSASYSAAAGVAF
ncbi:MAG: hypothetical protein V1929_10525 [bacterium]